VVWEGEAVRPTPIPIVCRSPTAGHRMNSVCDDPGAFRCGGDQIIGCGGDLTERERGREDFDDDGFHRGKLDPAFRRQVHWKVFGGKASSIYLKTMFDFARSCGRSGPAPEHPLTAYGGRSAPHAVPSKQRQRPFPTSNVGGASRIRGKTISAKIPNGRRSRARSLRLKSPNTSS